MSAGITCGARTWSGAESESPSHAVPAGDVCADRDRVLVTFGPATVFDGTVLFQALRFTATGGKKEGYRFWSAFAFET